MSKKLKQEKAIGTYKKEVAYTPRTLINLFFKNPEVQNIKDMTTLNSLYFSQYGDYITESLEKEIKRKRYVRY